MFIKFDNKIEKQTYSGTMDNALRSNINEATCQNLLN